MTRVFDRLMDIMEPDEWYTTMDLTAAVGTDNANVYKTLKKAARDGFIEKGPNRQLPWGMAAIWRLKPPSERSQSRNPLRKPLRKPLTPPLLKYRLCNTFIPLTYYNNCHDRPQGFPRGQLWMETDDMKGRETKCDPCGHCANLYSQSVYIGGCDYGNRVTEEGCDMDIGEWEPGCGSPCPTFRPILASDPLLEQIADEDEYRFWKEMQDEAAQEGCE